MLVFLFILLISVSVYISYYFNNKITNQRRQFIVLKRELNTLKNRLNNEKSTYNSLNIQYKYTSLKNGVTLNECPLYLYPSNTAIVLSTLRINTFIEIKDSAQVNNELWYEISVPSLNQINSKGWIKAIYVKPNTNIESFNETTP
ncbi:hypothetical protein [Clostridium rectalis]|uniref:hypothetical protein n=1 Tax=Clostridium rectalis TaxID=2040295 RepID=UPI000F635802|nr:hypothetical protein [Clostridium rectalis]